MATITDPKKVVASLSESSRKVHDPLRRLRGYIRGYVISEALTVLLICLAACFWIGLALDYTSFKLLGIDWARDLPRWLRAVLVAAGLITVGFVVEIRKSLRLKPHRHDQHVVSTWISRNPWALVAIFAVFSLFFLAGWVVLAILRDPPLSISGIVPALVVVGVLAAFTAVVIAKRLLYEFSDPNLALVLERRFPKLLGDRLITAVELADTRQAAKYGYSEMMVQQTIHEAAERVDRLNLREVFDWKRLYIQGGLALLLTVGIYAATLGTMMGVASANDRDAGLAQVNELDDSAMIWAQRNILLDNERWPTRCLVTLYSFPASGELKKGKGSDGGQDTTHLDLYARATEFAIHDSSVDECWRPLTLNDINTGALPVTARVDSERLPWPPRYSDTGGLTVDEIKQYLNRIKSRNSDLERPDDDTLDSLKTMLEQVEKLANDPSMSRTVRQLKVPARVTLEFRSQDGLTRGTETMHTGSNNEYSVELSIKDSISFYMTAEDYVSDKKLVTLVPPPRVAVMWSTENRPAYLYHLPERNDRILPSVYASSVGLLAAPGNALVAASALPEERPYDDDRYLLAPLRQEGEPRSVNVAGESRPKVTFPTGTDVHLVAETDKDLEPGSVKLDSRGAVALKNVTPVMLDSRRFALTVKNVRSELDFRLEFTDTDGAIGVQELVLSPAEDSRPIINQFKPEVVRQIGDRFKVAPNCLIPFSFFVKDEEGLASLDFVYSIREAPSPGETQRRAARIAAGVGMIMTGPEAPLTSYVYNYALPTTLRGNEEVIEGRIPVAYFQERLEQQRKARPWRETKEILSRPVKFEDFRPGLRDFVFAELRDLDSYLSDHDKRIEDSKPFKGMDLTLIQRNDRGLMVPLKARPLEIQRRYEMQVYLEARDTNVADKERGRFFSKPPFAFEIVSDNELLFEIIQEEQRQFDELARVGHDMKSTVEKLQAIQFALPTEVMGSQKINFEGFSVRAEDVQKVFLESKRITDKVYKDYDKILRELRTNRLDDQNYVRGIKTEIVEPLKQLLGDVYLLDEDGKKVPCGFLGAEAEIKALREVIDNGSLTQQKRLEAIRLRVTHTEREFRRLSQALTEVLQQMRGIRLLGDLIKDLHKLEQRSLEALRKLEAERERQENDLFKDPKDTKKP